MKTNRKGIELIKRWEGLRLASYRCAADKLTVGYGHTGKDVTVGMRISAEHAELLLREDLERFERGVCAAVHVPLTDNQFSALVSFTFNVGFGDPKLGVPGLLTSTMLRLINAGKPGAAAEFVKWNKARVKGKLVVLPGLTARRLAEAHLYLSP